MKIITNSGLMCDESNYVKNILRQFSDPDVPSYRTLVCEECLSTAKNQLAGYRKGIKRRRRSSDGIKME